MPLLQWLKNSLRTWLLEDDTDKDVSTELIVCIADRRIKAHAVEVAGRQLSCFVDSDGSAMLVTARMAEDEQHFWKLWKQLGGAKATWSDGTPFDPST